MKLLSKMFFTLALIASSIMSVASAHAGLFSNERILLGDVAVWGVAESDLYAREKNWFGKYEKVLDEGELCLFGDNSHGDWIEVLYTKSVSKKAVVKVHLYLGYQGTGSTGCSDEAVVSIDLKDLNRLRKAAPTNRD